jgi:hypothetical protein
MRLGGHLFDGEVWPTFRAGVGRKPAASPPEINPEIGLALLEV